jgi:plastocyanin
VTPVSQRAASRPSRAVRAVAFAAAALLPGPAFADEVIRVEIKDLAFAPVAFTARIGDTVEWVNDDFVAHSATARNGDWDVNLPAHQTRRLLIKRPGKVAFYCRFHPTMQGEVRVEAP